MAEAESKRMVIANRLRIARMQAGLSQAQVAHLMKIRRPAISEAEAGKRRISAEELGELARIYGVNTSWLSGTESQEAAEKVELAARELAKLKPDDLDRLLQLLSTLRTEGGDE
jgi:transcriptional regulator with XRE-family HTH domain